MEIATIKHAVRPHNVICIPPAVRNAIYNTGLTDLVPIVVAAPLREV